MLEDDLLSSLADTLSTWKLTVGASVLPRQIESVFLPGCGQRNPDSALKVSMPNGSGKKLTYRMLATAHRCEFNG